jgi:hypothetical protein
MKLPKSLDPETLLAGRAIPSDITLGESRAFIMQRPQIQELQKIAKDGKVQIRFWIGTHPDKTEAPDDMTISQWRKQNGSISIDDGSGGMRVKEKV